jgi:hypothetical protein
MCRQGNLLLLTDTVEKGFSGVAPIVRAREGVLELLPECNSDSPSAPTRNSILCAHHIISRKSDFFDSTDPFQT